jgi:trans-aconitate methyltransferase
MEFDMNQISQTSNSNAKIEASESQNSEVSSENSAVQPVEPENVDSNTLAAVLQFLQKHNLKVIENDMVILKFRRLIYLKCIRGRLIF